MACGFSAKEFESRRPLSRKRVAAYHVPMYEHEHHSHDHSAGAALSTAVWITLAFAAVEAVTGWWAGSLALIGDAGHMVTDSGSLLMAWVAARLARRPADHNHTWGHGRAEVVAALLSALTMLLIVGSIVYHAIERLREPVAVQGLAVIGVAAIGLLVNLVVLRTLSHSHQNLNTRGAVLHVMGDLFGSIAAVAAGVVIWLTGWTPIDPILSLLICVLIVFASIGLLRDALHVVMEGVPRHLDIAAIGKAMAETPGVMGVHDLHVWQVNSDRIALSAHVVLRDLRKWPPILEALRVRLDEGFGVEHVTLQPEPVEEVALPTPRAVGWERVPR